MFGMLLNKLGLVEAGAELGVFKGKYAEEMVGTWKVNNYHLVEPALSDELKTRLTRWKTEYPDKVKLNIGYSYSVKDKFPDGFFDFIYVDAGHSYKEVAQDLKDWYPK
eukprot:gene3253-4102_t